MATIDEQIEKINNEVALELCWAESYAECDEIIEKGKQKIKALTAVPVEEPEALW